MAVLALVLLVIAVLMVVWISLGSGGADTRRERKELEPPRLTRPAGARCAAGSNATRAAAATRIPRRPSSGVRLGTFGTTAMADRHSRNAERAGLLVVARVAGLVGVAAYNWWLYVLVRPGHYPVSGDGMFSDLDARSVPHSVDLRAFDVASGVLLLLAYAALWVRGRRRLWPETAFMALMAAAVVVGGLFPYQCAEGLSRSCRRAEWHLELPFSHYLHVVAGIGEFACVTAVAVLLWRRLRPAASSWWRLVVSVVYRLLFVAYPVFAVTYLSDHGSLFIEPVFLLMWSAITVVMLFAPIDP